MPHLQCFHPSNNSNPCSFKEFTSKPFLLMRTKKLFFHVPFLRNSDLSIASFYPPAAPAITDMLHLRRFHHSNNLNPSSLKEFTLKPFPRVCKRCLLSPLPFPRNSDLSMRLFIRRLHCRLPIFRTYGAFIHPIISTPASSNNLRQSHFPECVNGACYLLCHSYGIPIYQCVHLSAGCAVAYRYAAPTEFRSIQ